MMTLMHLAMYAAMRLHFCLCFSFLTAFVLLVAHWYSSFSSAIRLARMVWVFPLNSLRILRIFCGKTIFFNIVRLFGCYYV